MNETYGIELDLLTSAFDKKISNIKKQAESIKKAFDPNDISGMKIHWNNASENAGGYLDAINKIRSAEKTLGMKYDSQAIQNYINGLEKVGTSLDEIKAKQNALKQGSAFAEQEKRAANFEARLRPILIKMERIKAQQKEMNNNSKNSFISIIGNKFKGALQGIHTGFSKVNKLTIGLKTNVLKYAGALFGIRSIYYALKNSASAWLSSQNSGAKQLSANIEYLKYSMGAVFAPIIQYITSLVYNLMKAIQSLVYAFSGVNIFAKATASSMKSTAGSAKEAQKTLAGFDELNNINEDKGGESGTIAPNIDLSQMDSSLNGWIEVVKTKLEPLLTSIRNICENIGKAFKNAWENNGGTETIKHISDGLKNLWDIVSGVIDVFKEWTASDSFQKFANAIVGICNTLSYWFELITAKLKEIWENGGKETFEKLLNFISKVVEAVDTVLKALSPVIEFILNIVTPIIEGIVTVIGYVIDALSGVLDFIIGIFTGDWERAWNGICEFFTGIWNALVTIVTTVWDTIVNVVTTVVDVLWNIITTVFSAIGSFFSNVWNGIKETVSNVWNGITTTISNVINGIREKITNVLNTIRTVWNNIWNKIKDTVTNIWNGIWNTIKNVVNNILGGIENFVNGIIKGINKLLGGISKVANAVGSLIGLKPINLQLSTISLPRLDVGTNYVPEDQLAYIHKGEAVIPKKFNSQEYFGSDDETKSLLQSIIEKIDDIDFQPYTTIKDVGKTAVNYINSKNRQLGGSVIN